MVGRSAAERGKTLQRWPRTWFGQQAVCRGCTMQPTPGGARNGEYGIGLGAVGWMDLWPWCGSGFGAVGLVLTASSNHADAGR